MILWFFVVKWVKNGSIKIKMRKKGQIFAKLLFLFRLVWLTPPPLTISLTVKYLFLRLWGGKGDLPDLFDRNNLLDLLPIYWREGRHPPFSLDVDTFKEMSTDPALEDVKMRNSELCQCFMSLDFWFLTFIQNARLPGWYPPSNWAGTVTVDREGSPKPKP